MDKPTNEQIWVSYSNAIIHHMISDFNIEKEKAIKILDDSNLREHFLNNIDIYEFVEPYTIAEDLSENK